MDNGSEAPKLVQGSVLCLQSSGLRNCAIGSMSPTSLTLSALCG